MLDIKFIRDNLKLVKQNNKNKKVDVDVEKMIELDSRRREFQIELESLRNEKNKISKTKPNEVEILEMKKMGEKIKSLESQIKEMEPQVEEILLKIPNLVHESTPVGPDESGNKVLREVGKKPKFSFKPKEHWELGKEHDLIDNEKAAQIAGSRFTYLKGKLALLQFALINHALSILTDKEYLKKIIEKNNLSVVDTPFIPIIPPVFIKPEIFNKMARLEPKEERYYIPSDDLFLIGSAEHTLGPLHMDETIDERILPIRYVGISLAFRREAGSYGKDTKGILRVHQFDKIEMESFSLPEKSTEEQNFFVAIQEELMNTLNLPYRIVQICTGDMGGPDARQIDLETWMPGQNKYRETHTSDLMTDYQSRRLKTKYKKIDGTTNLVHMNDATAYAVGRTLIAIMENYQQEDGIIIVPEALRKYVGFEKI
ncbi:MAG: Serine-tRNA ligase [Candidatus Magasanikbacteria bacterium GW2011_GWC2_40_17]|uniref:Serine--tRNA ligase n=1 Tax=Candidatus Magasanikbacteria bacterium GW2011_GWA2_42_32 TaxID=1619039 RepID=A0A0G1CG34_9BACT|nr:MAG: Serine-tRNA ligase [Candidatus Magasanikbacteria bacterium GW2011_GWC2_40_17]KKS57526.1 MAG: Serine-tRNA ligase [Candidatus Magasanikbacteria bacterium GW2011_GWA2_42_32]OGH85241.1 MAG: serine--tRNA ligase [Candidatus Magasanikbacteria bacterium RIFOXYB2_FULL_38_10]